MQIYLDIDAINGYPPETGISHEAKKRCAYVVAEQLLQVATSKGFFWKKKLKYWEEVKAEIRKIKP